MASLSTINFRPKKFFIASGKFCFFVELVVRFGYRSLALSEIEFEQIWQFLECNVKALLLFFVLALVVLEFKLLVSVEKGGG
jgi:hypothetical protein